MPPRLRARAARHARLAAAGLLGFLPAACGGEEGGATASSEAPRVPVDVVVASRDTLDVVVRSVGSLEAEARTLASAERAGRITRINVREGDEVEANTVLAEIEHRELAAEVQASEAAVRRLEAEVQNLRKQTRRNEDLLEQGAISQQAYDDLLTRFESARAQLAESRARLEVSRRQFEETRIRAPFTGRLGERHVDVGDYVNPGSPIFLLVDDDSVEIEFSVPERYVGDLRPGMSLSITVPSVPDERFAGELTFVSPVVEASTRTVKLKAAIPNPEARLRAGQFADVRLVLERRAGTVVVPEAAVVPRQTGPAVFVVQGGRAVRRRVTVGERVEGRAEIRSGVAPGDTVVVAGQSGLQDGTPVNVRAGSGAGSAPPSGGAAARPHAGGAEPPSGAGRGRGTAPDTGVGGAAPDTGEGGG